MVDFYWHSYRYFPYERKLAERELRTLLGHSPEQRHYGLRTADAPEWKDRAYRTTYFCQAVSADGSSVVPLQASLEDSASPTLRLSAEAFPPVLAKQSTRYSAHGLHEYRGKFNPQIVRAIGNILGLNPGDTVLDPFCGSGTTILEAIHNGWHAVGIDANPLAVQIARAKVSAMRVSASELSELTQRVVENLDVRFAGVDFHVALPARRMSVLGGAGWAASLPNLGYLREWFQESVLVQLAAILQEISAVPSADVRMVLRTVLSDLLRRVSMQDPGDLRMRRLADPPENAAAVPLFLSSALAKVDQILRARAFVDSGFAEHSVVLGDARQGVEALPDSWRSRRFSAVLTSPPYATALPYIDTQRLSLMLFDHLARRELHEQERRMIGTREISRRERQSIDGQIASDFRQLPEECLAVCRTLQGSVSSEIDGFRRRNTPALLYAYLQAMAEMFRKVRPLLQPGVPFALVVGRNSTTLGGKHFTIDTPWLLTLVAQENGFEPREIIELDTYQRFDVHQANSIRTESLLVLRADDAG